MLYRKVETVKCGLQAQAAQLHVAAVAAICANMGAVYLLEQQTSQSQAVNIASCLEAKSAS
jgi:hypothetical protein